MAAIGNVDPMLVAQVRVAFEQKCIELLEWACHTLKSNKKVDTDWGEENISANIYTYIKDSQQSIDANIHVESEHPFYNQDILSNKKKARKASRIDMVFQNNWSGKRFVFYVEAKNLVENDFIKTGRKRTVKARTVLERYIETGIDHFLTGYYPKGCLLGYVLNGTINGVVNSLNAMLVKAGRNSELLSLSSGANPWMEFNSYHTKQSMKIGHYLFDFN
jgi:hypothetical protein